MVPVSPTIVSFAHPHIPCYSPGSFSVAFLLSFACASRIRWGELATVEVSSLRSLEPELTLGFMGHSQFSRLSFKNPGFGIRIGGTTLVLLVNSASHHSGLFEIIAFF